MALVWDVELPGVAEGELEEEGVEAAALWVVPDRVAACASRKASEPFSDGTVQTNAPAGGGPG